MSIKLEKIKNAYYLDRLSNNAIFKKFGLERTKSSITSEKIFKRFPMHIHRDLSCEFCGEALNSTYVGKMAVTDTPSFNLSLGTTSPIGVEKGLSQLSKFSRTRAILTPNGYRISFPFCPSCKHKPTAYCSCVHCLKLKLRNKNEVVSELIDARDSNERLGHDALGVKDCLEISYALSSSNQASFRNTHFNSVQLREVDPETISSMLKTHILATDTTYLSNGIKMINTYQYYEAPGSLKYLLKLSPCDIQKIIEKRLREIVNAPSYGPQILIRWRELAMAEASNVLNHYCVTYSVICATSAKANTLIQQLLETRGLALTSRFIYSSIRSAANYLTEIEQTDRQATGLINRNLTFWLEDDRAKNYDISPFVRTGDFFNESNKVKIFENLFLEPQNCNYFSDPICIKSMTPTKPPI